MTAAVCLECGKMKTGAWSPCPGCTHRPQTLEDRAKHLISTDHYQSAETLGNLSRMISSGQKPQFVESQVLSVMEELRRMDARRGGRRRPWWLWIILLVMAVAVAFWLLQGRQ